MISWARFAIVSLTRFSRFPQPGFCAPTPPAAFSSASRSSLHLSSASRFMLGKSFHCNCGAATGTGLKPAPPPLEEEEDEELEPPTCACACAAGACGQTAG